MALYRVEITTPDGETVTLPFDADNWPAARAKARAEHPGSTVGIPVLQEARRGPTVGAGDPGEEEGGGERAFRYVDRLPPVDPNFYTNRGAIRPPATTAPAAAGFDAAEGFIRLPMPGEPLDPGFVQPPAAGDYLGDTGFIRLPGIPAPPPDAAFPAFAAALETGGIDPDLFDPQSSTYTVPPAVVPPAVVPPAVVPPAVAPPAVSSWSEYFVPDAPPVNGGGGFFPPAVVPPAVVPPTAAVPPVVPPAFVPPAVVAPPGPGEGGSYTPPAVTVDPVTGIPVFTSRELMLDPLTERAGQRLAFRNIFGEQATGVGPLSSYLQRQLSPLTSAFRGGAWADMARGFGRDRNLPLAGLPQTAEGQLQIPALGGAAATGVAPGIETPQEFATRAMETRFDDPTAAAAELAGGAAVPAAGVAGLPGYSFEDFLRTTRDQPTGLGGAYGQALQNVGYLRGLGQGGIPPALAGILNPETSLGTWDARNLLGAAQKGRYSGLVSRSFRQPSQEDLFADYVLARQDATTAGQIPQNFFNFAASRYGL